MKRRLSFRLLLLTIAMLVVVVSTVWSAQKTSTEQTITVYKDPT